MKRLPYKKLETQVCRACKRSFAEMLEAYPNEHFYTFALFMNDAIQTLHPFANTEEQLDLTVSRYNKTVDKKYGGTSTRNGMRWGYGDWGVQDIGEDHFSAVNETLDRISNAFDSMEDQTVDECIERMLEAVLNGLNQLNQEKVFGTGAKRSQITLLIVGDLPESWIDRGVRKLNPPSVAKRYCDWDTNA